MLVLNRRLGASINIGEDIKITVLGLLGNQVRLGIAAPKDVAVHREEVHNRIQMEQESESSRPILHIQRKAELAIDDHAVELNRIGKMLFNSPQQSWFGQSPQVLQIAVVAGQQMIATRTRDTGASFELHYLGFCVQGFTSMENAIAAAPRIAREILFRLADLIPVDSFTRAECTH